MDAYDNWKTSPPEPKKVGTCALDDCGGDIEEGEIVYVVNGDTLVHEECFTDYAKQELTATLQQVYKPDKGEADHDC